MKTKKPIQSRVLWFNVLSVVAIVLTEMLAKPELREMFGGYVGIIMIAGAIVNSMLRLDTSKPISTKPPELNPVDNALKQDDLEISDGF